MGKREIRPYTNLGRLIKRRMDDQGYRYFNDLARDLGVSHVTVHQWVREPREGEDFHPPTWENIRKLSRILRWPAYEFAKAAGLPTVPPEADDEEQRILNKLLMLSDDALQQAENYIDFLRTQEGSQDNTPEACATRETNEATS